MSRLLQGKIHCREIREDDLADTAELLSRSFTNRNNQLLQLHRLAERQLPNGLPKFGYLLEHERRPVGAILTIFSSISIRGTSLIRCNLSSWHVDPEYRSYAPLLVSQALKRKDVTYLNVTARPPTWPIVMAQGFKRYSDGLFVAAPLLSPRATAAKTTIQDRNSESDGFADPGLDPGERKILSDHSLYGCVALVCKTVDGAHPFIFARRNLKNWIPCVHLVYCRGIDEFVRFAGDIGRFLAKRGILLVSMDANQPVAGLVGRHYPGKGPKFYKGQAEVRLGDLAYTNICVLETI